MKKDRLAGGMARRGRGGLSLWLVAALWGLLFAAAPAARAQGAAVQGTITFEKVPATLQGLRLNAIERRPAVAVAVQVVARTAGSGDASLQVLGSGVTDDNGFYQIPVTLSGPATVFVLVRAQADNAVVKNPSSGATYAVSGADFALAPGDTSTQNVLVPDSSRASGPFNILAVIAAANKVVRAALPGVAIPPINVTWATNVRDGGEFLAPNTLALNGDRSVDSDEFDDSVIGHEYGHFMQASLARDDTVRGQHDLGDRLHPPTAFSEGWADAFSQMLLNDPNYVDTLGANGAQTFTFNLEPNTPSFDQPGYWSQFTVGSVLWDLFDSAADAGDSVAVGWPVILRALVALRSAPTTYLIAYADAMVAGNRDAAPIVDGVTAILAAHTIAYRPGANPSVANPYPTPLVPNQPLSGSLNGPVPRSRPDRDNLYDATAAASFTLTSPANVNLLLQIVSSKTTSTSDLDLYLFDAQGNQVAVSDTTNGVGGTERITKALPAGSYRVEVWSFWFGSTVHYNSADFVLTLTTS